MSERCATCNAPLPHVEDAAKLACRVVGQMVRAAVRNKDGSVTIPLTLEMVEVALADDLRAALEEKK